MDRLSTEGYVGYPEHIMEMRAYKWNLTHMVDVPYPWDPIQLLALYRYYAGMGDLPLPI